MTIAEVVTTQQVVITEVAVDVLEVAAPQAPTMVQVVVEGPQGPAGGYVYQQLVASETWIINHGLGYFPSVELLDSGSQEIDGHVYHTSVSQTIVNLTPATAGIARLT